MDWTRPGRRDSFRYVRVAWPSMEEVGALEVASCEYTENALSALKVGGKAELPAGLDPLRPDWPELLKKRAEQLSALSPADYLKLRVDYERANPHWERQLANLTCYLVFRHWHKTVNDSAIYSRAAFVCASCAALYHLSLFQPGEEAALWTRFSREVEHDEDNLERLFRALDHWIPADFI